MRVMSTNAKKALFAAQTGECFLVILTLSHPVLPAPIRVVNNGEPIESRGETYQRFPFEIKMPDEDDQAPGRVTLRICNVDRQIVDAVRSLTGELLTVTMEIVLASSPDVVEAGPFEFSLRDARYDELVVEGELAYEDILNEPFPAATFTPNTTPGIF